LESTGWKFTTKLTPYNSFWSHFWGAAGEVHDPVLKGAA
jgi:hypothetical protein